MFQEISQNRRYGYVRISSKSQESNSSIDSQKQELIQNGILEKNIFIEIGSASDSIQKRPIFQNLIESKLKANDLLMVTKIDRCSRDTLSFLRLQEKLLKKSVTFISLDMPYSTDLAVNKLIATNLAAVATFENERRKERQRQGITAAKKAGKYRGRKTVITKKLIAEVKYLKQKKMLSVSQIVKITGRSRNTIYKVLKKELGYVSNRLLRPDQSLSGDVWEAVDAAYDNLI